MIWSVLPRGREGGRQRQGREADGERLLQHKQHEKLRWYIRKDRVRQTEKAEGGRAIWKRDKTENDRKNENKEPEIFEEKMRGRWSDHKQQEKLVGRNRYNKEKADRDKEKM